MITEKIQELIKRANHAISQSRSYEQLGFKSDAAWYSQFADAMKRNAEILGATVERVTYPHGWFYKAV